MKKNLSSLYTRNSVFLDKQTIIKTFSSIKKFNNEIRAYDTLKLLKKEVLAPRVFKVDYKNQILEIEYCPKEKNLNTEELIKFASEFHRETRITKNSIYKCRDSKVKWEEFLKESSKSWKGQISKVDANLITKIDKCLDIVLDRNFETTLIHRDFRNDNIGRKNDDFVLFDFELAMLGDPLWDCARILTENDENECYTKQVMELYDVDEKIVKAYKYLYGSSFLAFLLEFQTENIIEINKMIGYLVKEGSV